LTAEEEAVFGAFGSGVTRAGSGDAANSVMGFSSWRCPSGPSPEGVGDSEHDD